MWNQVFVRKSSRNLLSVAVTESIRVVLALILLTR